jgi:HAE1 family hydrophobic/amphiphilic exporter-1
VRSAVDQARQQLPREIDEPVVRRLEFESQPIITFAVASDTMSDTELSYFIDDTITRALLGVPGVSQINRVGGVERQINVTIQPDRLNAYGLTAPQGERRPACVQCRCAGRASEVGGREQTVRVLGASDTLEALRNLTIPTVTGRYVRLSDVAEIGDGSSEPRGFARLDGRPVVGFQVVRTKGSSDIAVEDGVYAGVAELTKANPDVTITKLVSAVDEVRGDYHATIAVLLEGMVLAVLVVFFFLRDWRSTVITAVAMPLSLIPTFAVMAVLGFSLNVVTLLALTLVIGVLIDDAIVEIENIQKRVETGDSPYNASVEGADSIGLAVVATTFAIVAVFMPVGFMPGIAGQFFREFGITVSVAVLFSLVVARLVTPLMTAYFLKPARKVHPRKPFTGWYPRLLNWSLDHRFVAAFLGGLLLMASFSIPVLGLIPAGFQPAGNANYIFVDLQGPPGATRADMERAVQAATDIFAERPEVQNVFAQAGASSGGGGGPGGISAGASDLRNASLTLVLKEERDLTVVEFKELMRPALRAIPDARATFNGDFGSAEVEAVLTSEDGPALEKAVLELQRQMRGLSSIADIRPSTPPAGPELVIRPKDEAAARLGVTSETLASILRVASIGDIDANVSKFTDGERRLPIRVRLPENARTDLDVLGSLEVPTVGGGVTTLASVADLSFQAGPARIDRYDRERRLGVQADLAGDAELGTAAADIAALPIMKNLPPGVRPAAVGDQEAMAELFGSMGLAMFAGVSLIFAVLVLLFRSFFKPMTILLALPLSIGGAFVALLVTELALSMPALIGFLMLLGLAAKNSILLVEYAIEREREGLSQRDALMEACRERARPIIMTSLAMIAGMLPTALGIGSGAEFRQPMAVSVIGGLITSTVLSLVLVPVGYRIIDDVELWLVPRLGRLTTPGLAPPQRLRSSARSEPDAAAEVLLQCSRLWNRVVSKRLRKPVWPNGGTLPCPIRPSPCGRAMSAPSTGSPTATSTRPFAAGISIG